MSSNRGQSLATLDETMLKALRRVHVNMPWKYLPDYLESVLELRINIEIGLEAEHLDAVPRPQFRSVADKLLQRGCQVTFHGPFWDLCPGSSDAFIRRVAQFRMQQLFDLVDLFQPIQVVCHTGYDLKHHGSQYDRYLQRGLAIWEPMVARAEGLKVPLLFENVWEHGPDFHRELFAKLDSPYCGFCLDVGHQHSFSITPLATWIDILGDCLKEIHLHDNHGSDDEHLPVGEGTIDFESLFRHLLAKAIHPLFILEPHREEDVAKSLAGLIKVMDIEGSSRSR